MVTEVTEKSGEGEDGARGEALFRHVWRRPVVSRACHVFCCWRRRGAVRVVRMMMFKCRILWAAGALVAAGGVSGAEEKAGAVRFEPNYKSLDRHEVPAWFEDAKLGIFVHWGIYSVPAFAPPSEQFGKLPEAEFFKRNPYAEWYFNSERIEGSATQAHHAKTYGAGYDYYRFAEMFERAVSRWDAGEMAEIFKSVHARYVVLTTKHHDGFTLWPSARLIR